MLSTHFSDELEKIALDIPKHIAVPPKPPTINRSILGTLGQKSGVGMPVGGVMGRSMGSGVPKFESPVASAKLQIANPTKSVPPVLQGSTLVRG